MLKITLLLLGSLCLFNIAVYANPPTHLEADANHKEEAGLGIGAIIGGLIAGPPGAIIGAAGGAWLGKREKQEDIRQAELALALGEKEHELAFRNRELAKLQNSFAQQLHKVRLEKKRSALEQLSQGVSLTVYFRSNSAEIDKGMLPHVERLARFLNSYPDVQLQLEAHADQRGDSGYNLQLSRQRAQSIGTQLVGAGIDKRRIHTHAYGESEARAAAGDKEGYVFDRRVTIRLSSGTEI